MEWSEYQDAIFDHIADGGGGDLIVKARAGSGKTATIVEGLTYVPKSETVLLVAFNKAIEEELSRKAPDGVEVRTFHGYGMRTLTKEIRGLSVNSNRTRVLCDKLYDGKLPSEIITGHAHVVSACKQQNFTEPSDDEINGLMARFGIDTGIQLDSDDIAKMTSRQITDWHAEQDQLFLERTKRLLRASMDVKDTIDFDDMVWLPNALGLKPFRYDRIFVDEAQDTNRAQVDLVESGLGLNLGRLTYVGDEFQQVYGWRGASLDAFNIDGATTLPLPICYRCARSIVRVARQIVPDIQPWEQAPEGKVHRIAESDIMRLAEPGDLVLSRTNGAIMGLWLSLIQDGKPARILGRGTGSSLVSFIKRSKASTIPELLDYTDKWLAAEIIRCEKKHRDTTNVRDKAACIKFLTMGIDSIEAALDRAEKMFTQNLKDDRITLSTVHKAKGLERRRVFALMRTFRWRPHQEEKNLFYVAITRAKEHLFLVGDENDHARCVLGVPPKRWSHPTLDVDWEFD